MRHQKEALLELLKKLIKIGLKRDDVSRKLFEVFKKLIISSLFGDFTPAVSDKNLL
jgi:predicted glycosyltransferase